MFFVAGFRKAGFFTAAFGFAIALTALEVSLAVKTPFEDAFDGVGVGVVEDALPKKL